MKFGTRCLLFVSMALFGCERSPASSTLAHVDAEPAAFVPAPARAYAAPVFAKTVPIDGDLPIFVVEAKQHSDVRIVFLHGACTHALGYIQAFQFAAAEHGTLIALQGEHDCGHTYRSWAGDAPRTMRRIETAFSQAGHHEPAPILAIGHSQGAILAASLAAKYPKQTTRLILIGSPKVVDANSLKALDGAVMMAGTFDNRALMRASMKELLRVGVPSTFIEIPNAQHGQLLEGERVMGEALRWLEKNAKSSAK